MWLCINEVEKYLGYRTEKILWPKQLVKHRHGSSPCPGDQGFEFRYLVEGQWRLHLDDVDIRSVGLHQDLLGPEPLQDEVGGFATRCSQGPVGHQLDSNEQPGAAYVANRLKRKL